MLRPLRSLRYRIVVSIVVIEVVMLSIMVWANTANVRTTHADRLAQSAELILQQFTVTVGRYLIEADYASLEEYSQAVMRHDELDYISVEDFTGRQVLAMGSMPASRQLDEAPAMSSDGVYDVTAPIYFGGRDRGRVDMGFSLALMQDTINAAFRRGVTIAAAEVILSVVVALFLGYALTSNLADLSGAVERYRRGDGDVSVPVRGRDEVAQLAEGFNAMVRDRAKAELDLRLNEDRLRQATELAGLGYSVWDADTGMCIHCSDEYARIHGKTVEDCLGRGLPFDGALSSVHPDDREKVGQAISALRKGAGFSLEYRVILASGKIRHIEQIAKPVFDETGVVIQECGAAWDITETKQAQEQLRQAQKMEAIGQLTGGIAHDFNNLLAIAMGNLELCRENLGSRPIATGMVDDALDALDRGRELTHRLLAFSRIQPLDPESVDPNALVAGLVKFLTRSLGETITTATVLAPDVWNARVDRNQIESAVLNLAVNARDAMPEGGTLTIETARSRFDPGASAGDDGDCVMIAVSDTGVGMTPDVLEQAFDPFFTTKEVGKGTGLGLSAVFGFIKQSGGQVGIESAPGHGTTVRLYLPRAAEGEAGQRTGAPPRRAPRAEGERVLAVEDDPGVRGLLVTMLRDLGYSVTGAEDGPSALLALQDSADFDLLLTDLVLPGGINGVDLAARACALRPALKVLYATGYNDDLAELESRSTVLLKPFRKADLARRVREVLGHGPRRARPAEKRPIASRTRRPVVLIVDDDPAILRSAAPLVESAGCHPLQAHDHGEALAVLDSAKRIDLLLTDLRLSHSMDGSQLAREAAARRPDLKVLYSSGDSSASSAADPGVPFDFIAKPYRREELDRKLHDLLAE